MKKKKLYIHIGTHKAGSTTIQEILKKESKALLEEGICYMGRFFQLSRVMRAMMEYDEKLVEEFKNKAQDELNAFQDNNPHTYVISNEKFSGHKLIAYKNAPVIARTLHEVFEPYDFEIKIVVYLRRQDKYFESMYAQKIKSLASYAFHEFLETIEDIHAYHWDSFLDVFAEFFGKENIIVRSFDRKYLPQKNSLIQSFGSIIHSDHLQSYSQKTVKNRGYSRDVLEVARLANKHLARDQKKILREILLEVDLPKDEYSFFTIEERKRLLENYQESNRNVVQKYFGNSEVELFSNPDYEKEETNQGYDGLTHEAVVVIFLKSLLVLNQKLSKEIELNKKMRLSNRIIRKFKRISSTMISILSFK